MRKIDGIEKRYVSWRDGIDYCPPSAFEITRVDMPRLIKRVRQLEAALDGLIRLADTVPITWEPDVMESARSALNADA